MNTPPVRVKKPPRRALKSSITWSKFVQGYGFNVLKFNPHKGRYEPQNVLRKSSPEYPKIRAAWDHMKQRVGY